MPTASGHHNDLVVAVEECTLGSALVNRILEEHLTISVGVDLLGLGTGVLRTQRRLAVAGNTLLRFDWEHRVVVEPGEPIWDPLVEALRSEDEQDSDIYFILFGHGKAEEEELGTAHINLEAMMKRGHDETHICVPVLDNDQHQIAQLTISVTAIAALKWVASGGGESLSFVVNVGNAMLSTAAQKQLGTTVLSQPMCVEIELPGRLPAVRTASKRPNAQGKLTFDFSAHVELIPGSEQHVAILEAMASGSEAAADVTCSLIALSGTMGTRERELGSGMFNMLDILRHGKEMSPRPIELRGSLVKGEAVCTVVVSLRALEVLRMLEKTSGMAAEPELIDENLRLWLDQGGNVPYSLLLVGETHDQNVAKSGIPFDVIDNAQTNNVDHSKSRDRRGGAGTDKALDWTALLQSANAIGNCQPGKNDFALEKWAKGRIQGLWRLCALFARSTAILRLQAQRARQANALEALRTKKARDQLASRQRQRLADARRDGANPHAANSHHSCQGSTNAQQAVLELYERLLHGMHGVLRSLLTDTAAMRRQCDEAGLLLESHVLRAERAAHEDALRFTHALELCSFAYGRDMQHDVERLDGPVMKGKHAGDSYSVHAIEALQKATAYALGESSAPLLHITTATDRGVERGGSWRGQISVDSMDVSSEMDSVAIRRTMAATTPLCLQVSQMRLRGVALQAYRSSPLQLALTLKPAGLHLPTLRTASVVPNLAQLDFGFEGEWTLQEHGALWEVLSRLLQESTPAASFGTTSLALRIQLFAGGAGATGLREVAGAYVPLIRLLLGNSGPVNLLSPAGGVFAECDVMVRCHRLLEAAEILRARAPTIVVVVRDLELRGGLERSRWGLWIETDVLGLADAVLRTQALPASDHMHFDQEWAVPVAPRSVGEERLINVMQDARAAIRFRLMSAGPSGSKIMAHGDLPLLNLGGSTSGPLDMATQPRCDWAQVVDLYPPDSKSGAPISWVGKLAVEVSLGRAMKQALRGQKNRAEIRLHLDSLDLSDGLRRDISLSELWVEVQMPPNVASRPIHSQHVHHAPGMLRPTLDTIVVLSNDQLQGLGAHLHGAFQQTVSQPTPIDTEQIDVSAPTPAAVVERSRRKSGNRALVEPTWNADRAAPSVQTDVAKEKISVNKGLRLPKRFQRPAGNVSIVDHTGMNAGADPAEMPQQQKKTNSRRVGQATVGGERVARLEPSCSVTFVLRGNHRRGQIDLGHGRIDLLHMLKGGEEKLRVGLTLADKWGTPAAQLQLSFCAQDALRAAWWAHARREHMHVRLHDVTLTRDALERASAGGSLSIWARISSAGILDEVVSSEVPAYAGPIHLNRSFEIWLAPNSEAAQRLDHALRSHEGMRFRVDIFGRRSAGYAGDEELHIGTANLALRDVLRGGGDLLHGALPLDDAQGVSCGELRLSLLAREVSLALFGPRDWHKESIYISLHSIELELPPQQGRSFKQIRVEIDFLAMSKDNWKSEAKPLPADGSNVLRLDESWDVPMGPGELALEAVSAAMRSVEEQDSDIYFVIFGTSAGVDTGDELGTAHVNLEQMLKIGQDIARTRLPVLDSQRRRVAWLTISVFAIEALTWVTSGGYGGIPIRATIGNLSMSTAAQKQLASTLLGRSMYVEIDFPSRLPSIRTPSKTPAPNGRIAFDYSHEVQLIPGSEQHIATLDALSSGDPALAVATVRLLSEPDASSRVQHTEIASAELNILDVMHPQGVRHTLELHGSAVSGGKVGSLEVSLDAQELAGAIRRAVSARSQHAAHMIVPFPVSPPVPDPPPRGSLSNPTMWPTQELERVVPSFVGSESQSASHNRRLRDVPPCTPPPFAASHGQQMITTTNSFHTPAVSGVWSTASHGQQMITTTNSFHTPAVSGVWSTQRSCLGELEDI